MSNQPATLLFSQELIDMVRGERFRDPFFDAVRDGTMPRAGLKVWVLQAALVVRQFTRCLSAMHSNCPYRDGQLLLAENLWEEHGNGVPERDHYALIRRLAASLGATGDEIDRTQPLPETAAYIGKCENLSRNGTFVEAIAAIGVAIEYFMPAFFGGLAAALRKNYGLSASDVEYLQVHVVEDAGHARRSLELIERYATSEESRSRVRQAVREMLLVKRRFSEAAYRACREDRSSRPQV
jgi:pyrroloquinoline-quinone synthase